MLGVPSRFVTLNSASFVAGSPAGVATIHPVDEGSSWLAGAGSPAGTSGAVSRPWTTPDVSDAGQLDPAAGLVPQATSVSRRLPVNASITGKPIRTKSLVSPSRNGYASSPLI